MKKSVGFVFILLIIAGCSSRPRIENIKVELIEIVAVNSVVSNEMQRYVDQYRQVKDELMEIKIGYTDTLMKVEKPEGLLNNFVADVMLEFANEVTPTDFAVSNVGGIRRDLFAGDITMGDIFEILPFDNTLVILEMTGKQVEELADVIAQKGGAVTSGISFGIEEDDGELEADDIYINGMPLDEHKIYTVVTNDYLSYGNDYFTPFKTATNRVELPDKLRDVVIAYIIKVSAMDNKPIQSSIKHDIYVKK